MVIYVVEMQFLNRKFQSRCIFSPQTTLELVFLSKNVTWEYSEFETGGKGRMENVNTVYLIQELLMHCQCIYVKAFQFRSHSLGQPREPKTT